MHALEMGLMYLLAPDVSIDLSGGIGLTRSAVDSYLGMGAAYRLRAW